MPKKINHLLIERKAGECIDLALFAPGLRKATAFLSPSYVIKATRQFKHDRRNTRATLLVTAGSPNFLERRFIRLCQKAGVCFPLQQIQLQWYNKPGKKK